MKIYISCDMEGISGVVHWDDTGREGQEDYQRFRKLMTLEANAAVEGALLGGATEVVVNDSHGGMRNIMLEDFHKEARLITGSTKFMSMMEGLDASYNAAIFIGYHARAGARGVLSHTYTGQVLEYRVNGEIMGETGMNAMVAGAFGVPVIFLSGDSTVTSEAKRLLGNIQTVAVKEAATRYAAKCLHPEKARELIRAGVQEALKSPRPKPLVASKPVTVSVKFSNSGQADGASVLPHSKREDDLTVSYTDDEYIMCLRAARAMMTMAGR